jgi:prepilin-type N-terminal cleavage/methylation domain-containing protein
MRSAERVRRGFTLLEVLAAVAVLAVIYTVLARVGIDGLRAEGESSRRLRAGLLADARLSEIEGQILTGGALTTGDTEDEVEEFVVRVSVAPLDLPLPALPEKVAERARERVRQTNDLRAAGASAQNASAGAKSAGSLFGSPTAGQPPPSRRIDVTVSWEEGAEERAVRRTSYGLDPETARPLLEALDAAAERDRSAADEKGAAARKKSAREGAEAGNEADAVPAPVPPRLPDTDEASP